MNPADIMVEATGSPQGLPKPAASFALAAPCPQKHLCRPLPNFDISHLVVDESPDQSLWAFAGLLRLLNSGLDQVHPMIHACYALDQGVAALGSSPVAKGFSKYLSSRKAPGAKREKHNGRD